jgi:hypothetical protein
MLGMAIAVVMKKKIASKIYTIIYLKPSHHQQATPLLRGYH